MTQTLLEIDRFKWPGFGKRARHQSKAGLLKILS